MTTRFVIIGHVGGGGGGEGKGAGGGFGVANAVENQFNNQ